MNYVGYAKVKKNPSTATRNFFRTLADISGKELPVIERNQFGDCMCVLDGKGLVDVDHVDVESYRASAESKAHDYLRRMFNGEI